MARTPLTNDEIQAALTELPGWSFDEDTLYKKFTFEDFHEAIDFIVRLALIAEDLNHHPDLRNVYNEVEIRLNTHDAGNKVTQTDVKLARALDGLVSD